MNKMAKQFQEAKAAEKEITQVNELDNLIQNLKLDIFYAYLYIPSKFDNYWTLLNDLIILYIDGFMEKVRPKLQNFHSRVLHISMNHDKYPSKYELG